MRFRGFFRTIVSTASTVLLALAVCGGVPVWASETGWPLDDHAERLTGFGERYLAADGSHATHRGIDLAAESGASVRAVLGGTVTFAGRVPAGEGATTIAITVQTGDVRVTLMPLSEASVRAGDTVASGDRVGVLAGTGDRSHAATHLHVGVRRGDLYIDPAPFLCAPTPATPHSEAADVRVPAPSRVPVVVPGTQPAPVAAVVPAPAAVVPQPGTGAVVAGEGLHATSELRTVPGSDPTPAGSVAGSTAPARSGPEVVHQTGSAPAEGVAGVDRLTRPEPSTAVRVAAGALDLEPGRVSAALAVDRKPESIAGGSPFTRGALLGVAALVAAVLLWPVWRSVPVPGLDVAPVREDVAAAVSR